MEQKNQAAQGFGSFGSQIPDLQQNSNSQGFQPNDPFYTTVNTNSQGFQPNDPFYTTVNTSPFSFPRVQPSHSASTTFTNPFPFHPIVQPPPSTTYTNAFNFLSNFNDDEPLPVPAPGLAAPTTLRNSGLRNVAIETSTEFPAVAASDFNSSFAVLLGIRAPPLPMEAASENQRVPIDLVAVLDVSGSMSGEKLSLLKFATKFVIDHMLPCDRLSIVSFASDARRILPLRRMTERGRKDAEFAVDLLRAGGGTNIVAGLNMGAQVLEHRRQCNPVSSIIFLSDGQDTINSYGYDVYSTILRWLSPSISSCNNETNDGNQIRQRFPVYTFGLGTDHDAIAMNAIADGSCGGTFSFVESAEMIPKSFARCIGGLFSVVAQEVRVMVLSASAGVEIKSIPSGRHRNEISCRNKQGIIHVGDLFAEEKKEFLIYLSVPIHSVDDRMVTTEDEAAISKTPLLKIVCYYCNAFTDEMVHIDGPSIEILRPITLSPADKAVNLKVDGQRNRVAVSESIAKAKEMADKGNLRGAKEVLTSSRETLLASASAQSGVEMVSWLEAELKEITARMESMDSYERQGRPFMLAGMSAQNAQRATTRNYSRLESAAGRVDATEEDVMLASAAFGCGAAYDTPMMALMQSKVQMPPPPPPQMPPPLPTDPKKDNGWMFQMPPPPPPPPAAEPKKDNGWRK